MISAPRPAAVAGALLLDAVLVIVFAISGRASHAETLTLSGVWGTAWPFLTALLIGWIAARAWRSPLAVLRVGVPMWVSTLALGMVIRVIFTNGGAAGGFLFVAAGALAVFLIGWRLLALLIRRVIARTRPAA